MGLLDQALPKVVRRPISKEYVHAIMPLVQERLKTLSEAPQLMDFFFLEELEYLADDLIQRGLDRKSTINTLDSTFQLVSDLKVWSAGHLEGELRPLAEKLEIKTGQLFGAIRVAVTGRKAAPPLFETMEVLGRDRCLHRLRVSARLLSADVSCQ